MNLIYSLCRDPVILGELWTLLLRFRMFTLAIAADMEKEFQQPGFRQQYRYFTRFL